MLYKYSHQNKFAQAENILNSRWNQKTLLEFFHQFLEYYNLQKEKTTKKRHILHQNCRKVNDQIDEKIFAYVISDNFASLHLNNTFIVIARIHLYDYVEKY
jgi:nucleoid-associated protein YejK